MSTNIYKPNIDDFTIDFANFLISQMKSKEEVDKIVIALTEIHAELLENFQKDPLKDFSEAYKAYHYLSINPFLKKIPKLSKTDLNIPSSPPLVLDKSQYPDFEALQIISTKIAETSKELADLAAKISALETNKRQPLEIFDLDKRYKFLRTQYKSDCEIQKELLAKLTTQTNPITNQ